jgi:alpha-L-fucosidase
LNVPGYLKWYGDSFQPEYATQKGNKVFVHNLSGETHLLIPDFGKSVSRIYLFEDGEPLNFRQDELGISVRIPPEKINEIDTIVVLEW